ILGSSETLAVGVLAATTTFRLTITDACGSSSSDVTIVVALATTVGLHATAVISQHQFSVSLTWPAIEGAKQYTVGSRSGGGKWQFIGTATGASFTDGTLSPPQT